MAMQSQPTRIPEPFAESGTKNGIPATNSTPSASQAASWASGFPPECSQPISAGGCPVPRDDFNGILNQLSQDFAFRQDGGLWAWSAAADYDTQRMVRGSDGRLYWSVQQSGPGTTAGAVDPVSDSGLYWQAPAVKTMDASDSSGAAASTAWANAWWSAKTLPSDLYVNPVSGSDSNTGYSAGSALKTIDAALNLISSTTRIAPANIKIHLAGGTYAARLQGSPRAIVTFAAPASGTPATVTDIYVNEGRTVLLSGLFQTGLISVNRGGKLIATGSAAITFPSSMAVSSRYIIYLAVGAIFSVPATFSLALNFTGTWTVSTGTVFLENNATFANGGTLTVGGSGSVTGNRYVLKACSVCDGMGSQSLFPGTASGTADSTCMYS